MKQYLFLSTMMFSSLLVKAQCPDYGSITANEKCIFISWPSTPAIVPDSLRYLPTNTIYKYVSITTGTPPIVATYRNPASGVGACSSASSDVLNDKIVVYSTVSGTVKKDSCNYVTGVLPLTLLSFDANARQNQNVIRWSVANVRNVSKFVIERFDETGISFKQAFECNYLQGISEYYFTDQDFKSVQYYRLTIIDFDGSRSYSNTLRVQNKPVSSSSGHIFPNPAQNAITIQAPGDNSAGSLLYIKSMEGRIVKTVQLNDQLQTEVLINELNPGIYIVQFADGQIIKMEKY